MSPPSQKAFSVLRGEKQRAITSSSSKKEGLAQSRNDTQLWICLVMKVKSDVDFNNIA